MHLPPAVNLSKQDASFLEHVTRTSPDLGLATLHELEHWLEHERGNLDIAKIVGRAYRKMMRFAASSPTVN